MDNRPAKSGPSDAERQLASQSTHSRALNPNQTRSPHLSQPEKATPTLPRSGVPKFEQAAIVSEVGSAPSLAYEHTMPGNASGAGSLYSYQSARDIAGFLKELHGRTFNSLNDAYMLPSDEVEWGRLDKQHSALVIAMGGLFPCPLELVEEVLSPVAGESARRILDVGCGTGTWAVEVAQKYPHCQVLGIDVAPIPLDATIFPPNLAFELDDVNQGLHHYHDPPRFDLIHMRCVMGGILDMDQTLRDLEMCLKPGGLLIVIDGDYPYDETREKYQKLAKVEGDGDVSSVSPNGSWFRRMMWETIEGSRMAGAGQDISPWIVDVGIWDHELCDPESTVTGGLYIPLGPWARGKTPTEHQMLKFAGILLRQVFLNIIRAWQSMILRYGVDQAMVDEWTRNADEELSKCTPPIWIRFRFFWTRRKSADGSALLRRPARPETANQYPAIEMYHSKEEAVEKAVKRKASLGELPKSAVQRGWESARAGGGIESVATQEL